MTSPRKPPAPSPPHLGAPGQAAGRRRPRGSREGAQSLARLVHSRRCSEKPKRLLDRAAPEMMPGKTTRKSAPRNPAPPDSEAVRECALQLRRVGDKWNLRQKILNMISKLFCPAT